MLETPALSAGEKRQRNDAHGFLRVISPVAVRHPGGADKLQLSQRCEWTKWGVKRRNMTNKIEHQQRAEDKAGNRRSEHGNDNFRQTDLSFHFKTDQSPPRRSQRGATQARRSARDWNWTAGRSTT